MLQKKNYRNWDGVYYCTFLFKDVYWGNKLEPGGTYFTDGEEPAAGDQNPKPTRD